ncbi:hypothetical protein Tco_1316339 [Tanacetum coccineum]
MKLSRMVKHMQFKNDRIEELSQSGLNSWHTKAHRTRVMENINLPTTKTTLFITTTTRGLKPWEVPPRSACFGVPSTLGPIPRIELGHLGKRLEHPGITSVGRLGGPLLTLLYWKGWVGRRLAVLTAFLTLDAILGSGGGFCGDGIKVVVYGLGKGEESPMWSVTNAEFTIFPHAHGNLKKSAKPMVAAQGTLIHLTEQSNPQGLRPVRNASFDFFNSRGLSLDVDFEVCVWTMIGGEDSQLLFWSRISMSNSWCNKIIRVCLSILLGNKRYLLAESDQSYTMLVLRRIYKI